MQNSAIGNGENWNDDFQLPLAGLIVILGF